MAGSQLPATARNCWTDRFGIAVAMSSGMTSPAIALASQPLPLSSEVSTTLSVSAGVAYEIFADVVQTPRWLPVVQSANVLERTAAGRPEKVAFMGKLERGSLGYTLLYRYDDTSLLVSWQTPDSSSVLLTGEARFLPLSARACLMVYRLAMELPTSAGWSDPSYEGHPASAVVADFREHLKRLG